MASSQVETASPVQEITDHAEEIATRPCAQVQKPETTTEEPKVDIHDEDDDDDDEIVGKENKEYSATGDELFKDDEDKVEDSSILSEEKPPVPTYGRKVDPEDDEDEDHDDEDEDEMI